MSNLEKILRMVSSSRVGLTARQIYNSWDECDYSTLRTQLSNLVRGGRLRVDGKATCEHCGHEATCYRISDQGRAYLARRS